LVSSRIEAFLEQRLKRGLVRRLNNFRIAGLARQVARRAPEPQGRPVVFFKASTGIDDLSWNSGFHLLASWAFRLQGIPVAYFACQAGMSRCVLGTNREDVHRAPPCRSCIYQSRTLYTDVQALKRSNVGTFQRSGISWFDYERDRELARAIENLSVDELARFKWPPNADHVIASPAGAKQSPRGNEEIASGKRTPLAGPLPLGELCLPGLRWILRVHHLQDDENTRYLYREYILSAWNVARKFSAFLDEVNPRAVVVFNGQFFPEATARWLALRRGIRVITHEVGLQPASAFFTDGEATAYPIHIPDEFELNPAQNAQLDAYLAKRFQGDFSMAGIKFWPDMKGLDEPFLKRAAGFRQIVPVFTNVIFDTSQPHANTVFGDMFGWLDLVLGAIRLHPETLFVIRAHPDELRVRKASRETVAAWAEAGGALKEPNLVFVGPNETLSSYELIQRSKFVLVYNSTIGLEASLMGKPVLCAGRARFTQYPTVFFPQTVEAQKSKLEEFLAAETIEVPAEFRRNARRFLYYQLFKTSLPFGEFLEPSVRTTQARLMPFELDDLLNSRALKAITEGVLGGGDFLLEA
jgi:hypothetical protein